jgi:hypothetical protein
MDAERITATVTVSTAPMAETFSIMSAPSSNGITGKITCQCCNTPVFEFKGGSLVIISRHHGNRHTTAFSFGSLVTMLFGSEASVVLPPTIQPIPVL